MSRLTPELRSILKLYKMDKYLPKMEQLGIHTIGDFIERYEPDKGKQLSNETGELQYVIRHLAKHMKDKRDQWVIWFLIQKRIGMSNDVGHMIHEYLIVRPHI